MIQFEYHSFELSSFKTDFKLVTADGYFGNAEPSLQMLDTRNELSE